VSDGYRTLSIVDEIASPSRNFVVKGIVERRYSEYANDGG